MRIIVSALAAMAFVSPIVVQAQSASLATQGVESAPSHQTLVRANRAGISDQRQKRYQSSMTPAGIDTSSRVSRGRLVQSGVILGLLSGAGVGAAVGLVIDSHENTIGVAPFVAAFGAAIGLITGLLVGVFMPER